MRKNLLYRVIFVLLIKLIGLVLFLTRLSTALKLFDLILHFVY